ncbi:unnamed protein product [Linum trigynum]|uniref:Uncharacterized protein n=1 Tax=Linum trigynum TaxID=586398 RepID=A0AAV2GME0_9ROSI
MHTEAEGLATQNKEQEVVDVVIEHRAGKEIDTTMGAQTPSPRSGLVDKDGFTLVVNRKQKQKVWVGTGSGSKEIPNYNARSSGSQHRASIGTRPVLNCPPSPPKGRGRGRKRG